MPKKLHFFALILLSACNNLPVQTEKTVQPKEKEQSVVFATGDIETELTPVPTPESSAKASNETIAKTTPSGLWQGFELNQTISVDPTQTRVAAEIQWHLRHPDYLKRITKRAQPYLFHIMSRLEQQQLPIELALLPIVESAYDPFAYSSGQAAGLWQFIPGTARGYGLQMDWWYDGRRDTIDATDAAIVYLKYLYAKFGSWPLALAAYNCGEGKLGRALRASNNQTETALPWQLELPRETKAYVPKWLALIEIMRNPKRYNVTLPIVEELPYFTTINLPQQLDIMQAAKLINIDTALLYRLNPGLSQWSTPPQGPHRLNIPATKTSEFNAAIAELDASNYVAWQRYQIKPGDSLSMLAKRFKTTSHSIKQANRLSNTNIRANDYLLIPTATNMATAYGPPQATTSNKYGSLREYRVKTGDSFWSIARNYPLNSSALARLNHLSPKDTLRIGQRLKVPNIGPTTPSRTSAKKINYRVRSGDSLYKIAQRFKVTIKQLSAWNQLDREHYLQPGQRLLIHIDSLRTI